MAKNIGLAVLFTGLMIFDFKAQNRFAACVMAGMASYWITRIYLREVD